jgi:subtilisin family serine protease
MGGTALQGREEEPAEKAVCVYIDEDLIVLVEDKVESLQKAVNVAHDRGIVVVAAAGNDSGKDSIPLSPHLPAAFPSVIGVAGSNINRQRSCFSNWGDVSAPAGDGAENPELVARLREAYGEKKVQESDCMPVVDKCDGRCAAGLTSLAKHLFDGQIGYAHWSGTSFAAPLVSGLAALIQDQGAKGVLPPPTWVPPAEVFAAVRCGAPTGDGVVDVLASLFRCMSPP